MMTKAMILWMTAAIGSSMGAYTVLDQDDADAPPQTSASAPTEDGATTPEHTATPAATGDKGTIHVVVTGLRNSDGKVYATIYNSPKGFPMEGGWKYTTAPVSSKTAKLSFTVPKGTYAISIFHDENSNGELDTNWLGIPKEGVGASNNAKGRMGPPDHEDAKFVLDSDSHTQRIKVAYL